MKSLGEMLSFMNAIKLYNMKREVQTFLHKALCATLKHLKKRDLIKLKFKELRGEPELEEERKINQTGVDRDSLEFRFETWLATLCYPLHCPP